MGLLERVILDAVFNECVVIRFWQCVFIRFSNFWLHGTGCLGLILQSVTVALVIVLEDRSTDVSQAGVMSEADLGMGFIQCPLRCIAFDAGGVVYFQVK